MSCEAVIREIGSCPASGQGYGGNPNVSWYPYTACIEDGNGADFRNGESVDLHMTVTGGRKRRIHISAQNVCTLRGRQILRDESR